MREVEQTTGRELEGRPEGMEGGEQAGGPEGGMRAGRGSGAQIRVRGHRACRVVPPCPGLTLGGRQAEHDHARDRAVLQDRPRLQNLCGERGTQGPAAAPSPLSLPPRPRHHLDSAGPHGPRGHNHSDSRGLTVAGMCRGGCGRPARGHWRGSGRTEGPEAVTGSQSLIPPPHPARPVALGPSLLPDFSEVIPATRLR